MSMTFTHQEPVADGSGNGFVSRQEKARLAAEAGGIVWPGTFLRPGTALYSSGVDKLKSDRAAWRRQPLASEVIGLVQEALKAEDRRDFPQLVAGLRFRELDGRLVRADHQHVTKPEFGLGYDGHVLRQLVQQIDPLDDSPRGFASALLYLSDQERARILNERISSTAMDVSTLVTLRTRIPHTGGEGKEVRIARAALSEKYGSVTDHDIAGAIGEMLQGDVTGRLDYKPGDNQSRFEVIWPSEIPVETFRVGDVHYGLLSISNSETGEGSLRIAPAVVRAACANLTLSTGNGTEVVIRHVGDAETLIFRLKKAIRAALDDMEPLIRTITDSARISIGEGTWTPAEALAKIARRYELPKVAAETWQKQLQASSYPDSIWGLTAAISEAAHGRGTWAEEAEWERVASEVQRKAVEVVRAGSRHADALQKALQVN